MTPDPKLISRCKSTLEEHGYTVFTDPMTTPAQVAANYGLSASRCSKMLKRFPGTFPCERGASQQRIRRLHVTLELDTWLRGPKRQHEELMQKLAAAAPEVRQAAFERFCK